MEGDGSEFAAEKLSARLYTLPMASLFPPSSTGATLDQLINEKKSESKQIKNKQINFIRYFINFSQYHPAVVHYFFKIYYRDRS